MKALVQRVKTCSIFIENNRISSIGDGILVLLGVSVYDKEKDADYLAEKISELRIFEDTEGKMNRSLIETGGEMMVVSQFTLFGDCRKGRRPSFIEAARPDMAKQLYDRFVHRVQVKGIGVQTGRFQAKMEVSLINDGPVTLMLESIQ
jgi:D-tyrosyl-tRNA(Tyr) deacylase